MTTIPAQRGSHILEQKNTARQNGTGQSTLRHSGGIHGVLKCNFMETFLSGTAFNGRSPRPSRPFPTFRIKPQQSKPPSRIRSRPFSTYLHCNNPASAGSTLVFIAPVPRFRNRENTRCKILFLALQSAMVRLQVVSSPSYPHSGP